ncbi:MAG: hypothetical protein ACOH5I_14345 [Oligoflexus sp.]
MRCLRPALLLLTLFSLGLQASTQTETVIPAQSRMVVDFAPEIPQEAWLAAALEQNVFDILSNFSRILPIAKDRIELSSCEDLSCRLNKLAAVGIEAYMPGRIQGHAIIYELYDVRQQTRIVTGDIPFQNTTKEKQQVIVFAAMKPFVEKSGIFDQNATKVFWQDIFADEKSHSTWKLSYFWQNLAYRFPGLLEMTLGILSVLFLCLPFLGSLMLHLAQSSYPRQWKSLLLWLLIVSCVLVVFALPFMIPRIPKDAGIFAHSWLLAIMSGSLWGAFVILHIDLLFPRFYEFEKMNVHAIPVLFEAWLWVFLGRVLVVSLLYLPIFVLGYFAAALLEMSLPVTLYIWLPALGLFAYVGLMSWLDFISCLMDRKYRFDEEQVLQLRSYFAQYAQRAGIDHLNLKRMTFLEGAANQVLSYGGGFLPARIVLGQTLISETFVEGGPTADFLFGALLRERGQIHRRGHFYQTLYLGCHSLLIKIPFLATLWKLGGQLSKKFWSRYPSLIADGYVAVNQGSHHLMQFYHVKQYGSFRSYQAGWERLRDLSTKIFHYAQDSWEEADRHRNLATTKHRIQWLQAIWLPELSKHRETTKGGRLTMWTLALALFFWFGVHCYQAVIYNPIYVERIEIQKREIEQQKRQLETEKAS